MKVKQISVFLENKSGRLHEVCSTLAENDINIRALCIAETADYGVLRLIVNRPEAARDVLSRAGFTVSETDVIAVEIPDRPGGLAAALKALLAENVNIEYIYCFVEKSGEKAMVVFRLEELDRGIGALQAAGFVVMRGEDAYSI
jgi:hypothetical protein